MERFKFAEPGNFVRITKEQYEWLRQYCFENRVAQAEVVREALEMFRDQSLEGMVLGAKMGQERRSDTGAY